MKKNRFKRMVDSKINHLAYNYLIGQVKSKGKEINYGGELQCQPYLLPNNILTHNEQLELFAYRSRMNNLKYNYGGQELCVCGTKLDNEHLLICDVLNGGTRHNLSYDKIFSGTLSEQKSIIQKLTKNIQEYKTISGPG